MRGKRLSAIVIAIVFVMGLGGPSLIPHVSALSWSSWTSAAVGDVSENSLSTYWTIVNTPISGYESHLWSDWHTVIDSEQDNYDDPNDNKEILFSTYSSASLMGIIEFTSKAKIENTEELVFRGRFGVRYSYAQVRTVGYVEIYDLTAQESVWRKNIESGTTANSWKWEPFSVSVSPINSNHDYVIRLMAKDAWIQQKVEVAFESTDVWFHAPYWRTLVEQGHSWRYVPGGSYYLCTILSDFYFKSTQIYDLNRDHRPYVTEGFIVGDPYGWDPCYLHEFRSYLAGTYEGDEWYATDMPGSVGYTDSSEAEELLDGFEEVEVYSRNPELFVANQVYYVQVRYQVWNIGWVNVVLEAELGNEDDNMASLSPPAFPVAYMDLESASYYHSSKSFIWYPSSSLSDEGHMKSNEAVGTPVSLVEHHHWYDVIVEGIYPYYIKVFTRINVGNQQGVDGLKESMSANIVSIADRIPEDTEVRACLTFDGLASVDDVLSMVERFGLKVDRFRFTAQKGEHVIRGQGTPNSVDIVPLDELKDFVPGYDLLGIQSIDVRVNANLLESLAAESIIQVLDISAFLSIFDAGLELDEYQEVHWYTEDVSWYISQFANS